jgi:hypothetical protein
VADRPGLGSTKYFTDRGSITFHADGHTYTYTYGPKGLAGLWHNRYALFCAIFASIGGLTFGYDQGVIANVLVMQDFAQRWPMTSWQKGAMSTLLYFSYSYSLFFTWNKAAVLELGALFGALSAGVLADRCSRRHSILAACSMYVLLVLFRSRIIKNPASRLLYWLCIPMWSPVISSPFHWACSGWVGSWCTKVIFHRRI